MELNTLDLLIANLPNFAGFVLLAFVLWKLLNDTLNNLRERIKFLEDIIIRLMEDDSEALVHAKALLKSKVNERH